MQIEITTQRGWEHEVRSTWARIQDAPPTPMLGRVGQWRPEKITVTWTRTRGEAGTWGPWRATGKVIGPKVGRFGAPVRGQYVHLVEITDPDWGWWLRDQHPDTGVSGVWSRATG